MRVAIISSYNFHNECIGFLCELLKDHTISLYVVDSLEWATFYRSLYTNIVKVVYNPSKLDCSFMSTYDVVIKLTSNDTILDHPNIISLLHLYEKKNISKQYISLTPVIHDTSVQYMYPIYTTRVLTPYYKNIITFIGYFMDSNYDDDLENLITKSNYIFNFIRYADTPCPQLTRHANVRLLENVPAPQMADIISNSKFLLSRKPPNVHYDRFSGIYSLAMSFRKPIIVDTKTKNIYGMPGLEFNTHYSEIIESLTMPDSKYNSYIDEIDIFNEHTMLKNKATMNRILNIPKNTVLLVEPRIFDKLPLIVSEYYKFLGDSWHYVFYCGKGKLAYWKERLESYVELRELDVDNFISASEYSFFMKQASLWESLYGNFVLSIQADTWIMNLKPYTIDYFIKLNKSYIGGNMDFVWNELKRENLTYDYYNFNGGLSLRKRHDMLTIISKFAPKCLDKSIQWSQSIETDPEDVYFIVGCHKLGLPLGTDEESSKFAVHKVMKDAFFGIHQPAPLVKTKLFAAFPSMKAPYL